MTFISEENITVHQTGEGKTKFFTFRHPSVNLVWDKVPYQHHRLGVILYKPFNHLSQCHTSFLHLNKAPLFAISLN